MAKKDKDEAENEPLTEEQRISALEANVGTNKIVLIVLALVLIISVSVSITVFTVSAFKEEVEPIKIEVIDALKSDISSLNQTIDAQKIQIQKLKNQIPLLQEMVESSGSVRLQAIVLEQEKAHIEFLDTLQTGMYDLAHMVPGSRTWLELYGEKVEAAKAHALSRSQELEAAKSKKPSKEEEDPFADGF